MAVPQHKIDCHSTNKNIIMSSFKSSRDIQKKVGQTAVSDNQSSSVTLKKARKIYCNFEFQRSHTMTEINLNRAQITKTV